MRTAPRAAGRPTMPDTRTRFRRLALLLGSAAVAILLAALTGMSWSHSWCEDCGSLRDDWQLRLGWSTQGSIPLMPVRTDVTESHYRQDFLPLTHAHRWTLSTEIRSCLLGSEFRSGRHPVAGLFSELYESNASFRKYIAVQSARNIIGREQLHRLYMQDSGPDDIDRKVLEGYRTWKDDP
jgi:hypothetical protein